MDIPNLKQMYLLREKTKEYFRSPGGVRQCLRVLRKGLDSDLYADFDNITIDPFQTEHIVQAYVAEIYKIIREHPTDFLAFIEKSDGGTIGAIRLAAAISILTRIPNITIRLQKEIDSEKLKIPLELDQRKNLRFILLTDHSTTGGELIKSIKVIRSNGAIVTDIIAYSIRHEVNIGDFEKMGIKFHYIQLIPDALIDIGLRDVGSKVALPV